jgi:CheY-like chemotaxis protein
MEVKYKARCSLILDDNPARYTYLIKIMVSLSFPYCDKIVIVSTAERAIEELKKEEVWNIIMLDHDLDGSRFISNSDGTGYDVAKFIKDSQIKYNLCIIHTTNDHIVNKMMKELKDTGIVKYKPCVDLGEYAESN